ncbi:hypothetical protein T492DRAFT_1069773 [Pavlovales sp. CCMP2436]|nr:hypothetical protein T492DRAFT_1069773 [Pavlovales sp. CCMP2436]|mmetsp:Transcript_25550/g.64924  ORF Transcript_25550/g.64924 Transcript_25550/m.64924 type:complete len:261 (-) Transcript_25550:158-940(-)
MAKAKKGKPAQPKGGAVPPGGSGGAPPDAFARCLRPGADLGGLALELVPAQPGFIITVPLFDVDECAAVVAAADSFGWASATAADRAPKKGTAYLDRDRVDFQCEPFSAELWLRLLPHLPSVGARVPVGLHADGRYNRGGAPTCRVYRYTAGHQFGSHVDMSSRGPGPGEETEFTLLVYLCSQGELPPGPTRPDAKPLVGGDTVFWASARTELCRASPVAGLALLHAHGRRCLMHESEEVRRGVKYVLRVDVLYGPGPGG